MATNQPTGEKTAFIRTQPAELSTAEVMANAKAAGLPVTGAYVRRVRAATRQAAKAAKPAKPGKAAKRAKRAKPAARAKTPPAATVVRPEATAADPNDGAAVFTQADYIRSHPELSVNELVAQAAAEGHDISANNVRVVRATGRKAPKKREARKARKGPSVAAANPLPPKRGPGRPPKTSTAVVRAGKEPPPAPKVLSAAAYVAPVAPPAPENHFRALVGELGLMRATQLLEDERNRVAKLLRA